MLNSLNSPKSFLLNSPVSIIGPGRILLSNSKTPPKPNTPKTLSLSLTAIHHHALSFPPQTLTFPSLNISFIKIPSISAHPSQPKPSSNPQILLLQPQQWQWQRHIRIHFLEPLPRKRRKIRSILPTRLSFLEQQQQQKRIRRAVVESSGGIQTLEPCGGG